MKPNESTYGKMRIVARKKVSGGPAARLRQATGAWTKSAPEGRVAGGSERGRRGASVPFLAAVGGQTVPRVASTDTGGTGAVPPTRDGQGGAGGHGGAASDADEGVDNARARRAGGLRGGVLVGLGAAAGGWVSLALARGSDLVGVRHPDGLPALRSPHGVVGVNPVFLAGPQVGGGLSVGERGVGAGRRAAGAVGGLLRLQKEIRRVHGRMRDTWIACLGDVVGGPPVAMTTGRINQVAVQ